MMNSEEIDIEDHLSDETDEQKLIDTDSPPKRRKIEQTDSNVCDTEQDNSVEIPQDMTPREKKLFDLQLRMNEARKRNKAATKEEHKRFTEDPKAAARRKKLEAKSSEAKERTEMIAKGMHPEQYLLEESIEQVEWHKMALNKKKGGGVRTDEIYDPHDQQARFNSYLKRIKTIKPSADALALANTGNVSPKSRKMERNKHVPTQAAIDNMVTELANNDRRCQRKRKIFYQDKDIDYISHTNKLFNEKADRAFGKYTATIKANFERGTAL